jgi:predicted ATPase
MSAPGPPTFARLLRRHRLAAGLSQEELAERAGLSARGVSDIERGLRLAPRPETVRMLADALGLGDAERSALIAAVHPELAPPTIDHAPPPKPAREPSIALTPVLLPIPPTRLVGRAAELARLRDLFAQGGARLVTLTGPGGVGKTRLVLEFAAELDRDGPFAGAVALVELAALRDPAQVLPSIGRALGLRESAGVPIERQVTESLAGQPWLLILDNCEHLLAAAPVVADLLAASPGLAVLTTSRERLRLRGERVIPLPPLALDSDAVRLLVERITDIRPDFALTEANKATVLTICERLDGLPLALELAAAWASAFPPAALLAHLDRRLPMLVGGAADLPARQQALRDTIAWSYDLLSPDEQALFRRLGVFAGGFALEEAQVVGGQVPAAGVPAIMALHEKSLLRATEGLDGQPRFTMLETIREFAIEMLEAAGEAEAVHAVHARCYLALAVEADRLLGGPAQIPTLRRLDAEDANLDVALDWLIAHDPAAALEMASSLWLYWSESGRQRNGRNWLQRALEASEGEGTFHRARALLKLGNLAIDLADFPEARAHYEASLGIWRALDESRGIASCLTGLGLVAAHQGDPETALANHEESLRIWQATDDKPGVALCLLNLGHVHLALGNLEDAEELFRACLEARRGLGDELGIAYVHVGLARVAAARHEPTEARRLLSLSQDLFERMGDPNGQGHVLTEYARLASDDRSVEESLRLYREALRLRERPGDRHGIIECLEGIALLWAGTGASATAVMLFAAAERWRERMGSTAVREDRSRLKQGKETARGRLPAPRWNDLWTAGAELSLEEAARFALGDVESELQRITEATRAQEDPITCVR